MNTLVSGQAKRLNLWKSRTRAIFISSWASLIPTQLRGPAPKGMYTNGWRLALASGVNLGKRVQSNHEVHRLSYNNFLLYHWAVFPTSQGWTGQDRASVLGHDGGNRLESQKLPLLGMTVHLPHSHVQSLSQTYVKCNVLIYAYKCYVQ